MLHSACIDGKTMENQSSNCTHHNFPILHFSYTTTCRKRYIVHIRAEDWEGGTAHGIDFHCPCWNLFFRIPFIPLYLTSTLQGFGRSGDELRPTVVEEVPFSEEVACGGYHTCVVTGIVFLFYAFMST